MAAAAAIADPPPPSLAPRGHCLCVCVLYMCTIDGTIIVVVGSTIVFCSLYVLCVARACRYCCYFSATWREFQPSENQQKQQQPS